MGETAGIAEPKLLGGRYSLGTLIGRGGMAAVHRGHDQFLDREVAIKIFRAAAVDQADADRQEAEIRTLAALNHPSLVTVLDAGVFVPRPETPTIFLVMELLSGDNLQSHLKHGPLSPGSVARLGTDLAEGLSYLGERRVVHRDIKPGNILLAEYSHRNQRTRAKLIDFGIAQLAGKPQSLTPGTTTGTAPYLSPEQANGEDVGPPSDIYSLGLVLIECLTGERVFPGDAIPSAMARLINDPRVPESLSRDWRSLLTSMTAREPYDRIDIADVVAQLEWIAATELPHEIVPARARVSIAAAASAYSAAASAAAARSVIAALSGSSGGLASGRITPAASA
ncbi:serine/threonine-protein kinase [Salinibacterium hongtaonis]|uniref:non-specific serine/threonine protein kinase n=1 Tax=Homoserinimonas hongtaonis TaxID=2079791 RepID=A0A2U1SZH0_9MICO|nr:serine/threonine-protein kinase [Salinibacterium hongtaonis]PWB97017.1 serine/threonine protein kinase [Salinibacterium hongtaonis]